MRIFARRRLTIATTPRRPRPHRSCMQRSAAWRSCSWCLLSEEGGAPPLTPQKAVAGRSLRPAAGHRGGGGQAQASEEGAVCRLMSGARRPVRARRAELFLQARGSREAQRRPPRRDRRAGGNSRPCLVLPLAHARTIPSHCPVTVASVTAVTDAMAKVTRHCGSRALLDSMMTRPRIV